MGDINIGDVFRWLEVVDIEYGVHGGKTFVCRCKCDNIVRLEKYQLERDYASCGCKKRKHGFSGTRIYKIWVSMKQRCYNPKTEHYEDYGGRGIKVCDNWQTFEGFYKDMKEDYEENLTLDRIDFNGDYTKENCRWTDIKTQMNNMRKNHFIEYNGKTYTLSTFAEEYNLDYHLFRSRILRGFSVEKAMEPRWIDEITYNGETKPIREFAKEYGLNYNQLKKRLMWGWEIERALTQPLRERNRNK